MNFTGIIRRNSHVRSDRHRLQRGQAAHQERVPRCFRTARLQEGILLPLPTAPRRRRVRERQDNQGAPQEDHNLHQGMQADNGTLQRGPLPLLRHFGDARRLERQVADLRHQEGDGNQRGDNQRLRRGGDSLRQPHRTGGAPAGHLRLCRRGRRQHGDNADPQGSQGERLLIQYRHAEDAPPPGGGQRRGAGAHSLRHAGVREGVRPAGEHNRFGRKHQQAL